MSHTNWILAEELARQHADTLHRELEHDRLLAANGLDLWSVVRRAVAAWLPRRRPALVVQLEPGEDALRDAAA